MLYFFYDQLLLNDMLRLMDVAVNLLSCIIIEMTSVIIIFQSYIIHISFYGMGGGGGGMARIIGENDGMVFCMPIVCTGRGMSQNIN